jgi:hypothetical protein
MAEGSVQPPEGLIREVALRMCSVEPETKRVVGTITMITGFHGSTKPCEWCLGDAAAVLAALFDACEVREQWGVRNTWPDGRSETYWRGHRSYAEAVVRAQLKLGSTVERQLVRRCDLLTPPESVVSYPENQEDGD